MTAGERDRPPRPAELGISCLRFAGLDVAGRGSTLVELARPEDGAPCPVGSRRGRIGALGEPECLVPALEVESVGNEVGRRWQFWQMYVDEQVGHGRTVDLRGGIVALHASLVLRCHQCGPFGTSRSERQSNRRRSGRLLVQPTQQFESLLAASPAPFSVDRLFLFPAGCHNQTNEPTETSPFLNAPDSGTTTGPRSSPPVRPRAAPPPPLPASHTHPATPRANPSGSFILPNRSHRRHSRPPPCPNFKPTQANCNQPQLTKNENHPKTHHTIHLAGTTASRQPAQDLRTHLLQMLWPRMKTVGKSRWARL